MKNKRTIERSYIARHRQAFRHAADLAALLDEITPANMTGQKLMQARAMAQDVDQCVHEMNAYWNVLHT